MKKKILTLIAITGMTILATIPAQAAWQCDANGWWWQNKNGSYPAGTWEWLDGNNDGVAECYHFNQNGYMLAGTTTPDGYQVGQDGAWVVNGVVQTKRVATVNYVNGVPYYTYPKDEATLTEISRVDYDEVKPEEIALKVVELVNKERRKVGKAALSINNELMDNASVRAKECEEKFAHVRPDKTMCNTAIPVKYRSYGENLFLGYYEKDVESIAMESWMNSAGHKKNILGDSDEIGVGVYLKDNGSLYMTQIFIKTK